MEFSGKTANLTVASLALAVLRVDHIFEGMAFSIHSYEEGTDPEVSAAQGTESQSAMHSSKSSFTPWWDRGCFAKALIFGRPYENTNIQGTICT